MNPSTRSLSISAVHAAALAALLNLAGCAHAPVRHQTLLLDPPAPDIEPGVIAPVPLHAVQPRFPRQLLLDGVEGMALITCLVDEHGRVRETRIDTPSAFGDAAAAALRQWTFVPATRDGKPAAMWVHIPFMFTFDWMENGFIRVARGER